MGSARKLLNKTRGMTLPPLLFIPFLVVALPTLAFASNNNTGLLVVGGMGQFDASRSAELWAPNQPSCHLPDLPEDVEAGTLDLVGGVPTVCQLDHCLRFINNTWQNGSQTLFSRYLHTSAVTSRGLLLVGGIEYSNTTELLKEDGTAEESFPLLPGRSEHCSVQVSTSSLVVIGGSGAWSLVTEYSGLDEDAILQKIPMASLCVAAITSRELPQLVEGRQAHACGSYMIGDVQMLLVTGGYSPARALDSTEVLDFTNAGQWRQTSPLPESRWGVRGASLGEVFHILGGQRGTLLTSVLAWEPVEEIWQEGGELAVPASYRAVAEVPMSIGGPFCF